MDHLLKKTKVRLAVLFLAVLLFMVQGMSYASKIDPSFTFSTIETEHFVIHFHQGLDGVARKAASLSEDIYRTLTVNLMWQPSGKTRIVLLDNMDIAGGTATVIPYNAIYINVVPPLHESTIGEYDDWLKLVLLHEYAHILTMDTSRGYSTVTRNIFGKPLPGYDPLSVLAFLLTAPPNVFLPDWWVEGVATWAETEFTSAGRGRSSFVDMMFRMSVLEDSVPAVGRLNGDVPYWPSGSIPYIYGMLLQRYIALSHGGETPGRLSTLHSGRLPFMISAPARETTGENYARLYSEMVQELQKHQFKKIDILRSAPLTNFTRLPIDGEIVTQPRLSPDGVFLAVNRRDPHMHEEILIVDPSTYREVAAIRRLPSDRSLSWAADSQTLYFTQIDYNGTFNLYQDIYAFSMSDKKVSQVTNHVRAKDIDVSPDGGRIAFVQTEEGRQTISVLSLKDSAVTALTDPSVEALSHPRWSADSRSIVFTQHHASGGTSIEVIYPEQTRRETFFKDRFYNLDPLWTHDGKYILFSSNRTGVYNLFAYAPDEKKFYQITHVMGGAFQPEVSWKDMNIFFSGYWSRGFFAAQIPYDITAWNSGTGPVIGPSWDEKQRKGGDGPGEYDAQENGPVVTTEKSPYCPLKTLVPRFWLPTLSSDQDGPVFGAFTAGQDVLGYHTYIAQGGFGTGGEGYYDVTYVYDRWTPTFFLRGYSMPALYSEFFSDEEDYYERRSGLTAGAVIPLPMSTLESVYSITAGYSYLRLRELTEIENRRVDGLEVYEGRRDSVFAGFLYSGALRYPYSISREEGRTASFLYRKYLKKPGDGLNQTEYSAAYEEFIPVREEKNDVVYARIKGAASQGEQIAQQAYQIGGIPSTINEYPIRGFSSGFETGKYVMTGTLEYRFPVKYFFRGWNTKPLYLDRLHMAVFADAGNVWGNDKGFRLSDFSLGTGVEARVDLVLGYKFKLTPAIGIAQGVSDDGETQAYITVYTQL